MQEQYSGTIPQAAGNFGRRMLPCALEDPETSKQDTDLPRLKNSLNRKPNREPLQSFIHFSPEEEPSM
jgi:hypothetical protein